MRRAVIASALIAAASFAQPLGAQRVAGAVLMPDGATSAAGVVVLALDASGNEVARAVTGRDGRYSLQLPAAATVSLRLLRVGLRPTDLPARAVGSGETITGDAVLSGVVVRLPAIAVRGATTCRAGKAEEQEVIITLLDEARKALLAARLADDRPGAAARWATFEHTLAANGRDTLFSRVSRHMGATARPFLPVPVAELQRRGFVTMVNYDRVFRAPDLDVLLSPWFVETHCFTLEQERGASRSVAFRPVRTMPEFVDVRGALVFDHASLELRRIDFRYVGLRGEEDRANAGGRVRLARTQEGSWFVASWDMQFPVVGSRTLSATGNARQSVQSVSEITSRHVVGGAVSALLDQGHAVFSIDVADGRDKASAQPVASASERPVACSETLIDAQPGAARGRLATPEGRGISGVIVRASWKVPLLGVRRGSEAERREYIREAVTDARGEWALCDLPERRPFELSWYALGRSSVLQARIDDAARVLEVPSAR